MKIGLLHPGQMGAGIASVLLHEGSLHGILSSNQVFKFFLSPFSSPFCLSLSLSFSLAVALSLRVF